MYNKHTNVLFLFPSWKLLFIGSIFYDYQQERQILGELLLNPIGMTFPMSPMAALFSFRDHSNLFI